MSTQKSMYIIAIVLLAVVSSVRVNAESLVDTSVSIVTETEGVVRNDTLEVEAAGPAQQNTETELETSEKISQGFGTGSALTQVVNALIAGSKNEGEDFCKALDASLMKQSDNNRASLAWNASSYEKNINLKFQGKDPAQASLHESTQNAYKEASAALKSLKPKSDKAIDSVMLSRYQAIARSLLIEMNMVLKAKEFDATRAEDISKLLNQTITCIDAYAAEGDANSEALATVKSNLGEIVAGWDASKNSFGVEATVEAPEAFSLKVTQNDTIGEEEKVPESAGVVSTKEELSLYVRKVVQDSDIIKEVSMTDSTVTLKLASRGKLFGFLPMWLSPKVSVNTAGDVSVKYPWYTGISSKKVKFDAETIKSELVLLGLVSEVNPETYPVDMSMEYRAKLVEALNVVIEAKSTPSVEAKEVEATEEVEAEVNVEEVPAGDIVEVAPQA